MPITPHFDLSQTESHVTIEIRVPHVRVSVDSVEVLVDGSTFHFSSAPYLLVLDFPAPLRDASDDDDANTAKYDPVREGGMITVELVKLEAAMWDDLDMIGKLMRSKKSSQPVRVTILSEESNADPDENDEANQINQKHQQQSVDIRNIGKSRYGFLHLFVGVFSDLAREGLAAEMIQLPNPDETEASERRPMRLKSENENFDDDRYLGDIDVEEDYMYQCAMSMKPHWTNATIIDVHNITDQMKSLTTKDGDTSSFFTQEERAQLASIPYPIMPPTIDEESSRKLMLGLLDLLFAYTYDHLLTDGDPTIESSWTICTLSSLLSWLDDSSDSVNDVVCQSMRRSLVFPYIRNYEFGLHCWQQALQIVKQGRRCAIRSLLQIRQILDKSETHYLGNKLFVDPYLSWLQRYPLDELMSTCALDLGRMLTKLEDDSQLGKESIGLDLVNIEKLLDAETDDSESDDDEHDSESCSTTDDTKDGEKIEENKTIPQTVSLLDDEVGNQRISFVVGHGKTENEEQSVEPPPSPQKNLIQEL